MKATLILFVSLIISQISFAQTSPSPEVWGRFTCYLQESGDSLNQVKSLVLDIGQPEEGWPLVGFWIDGAESLETIRQFQFELNPNDYKINSHIVWVEKIESTENSKNDEYNRVLSVAKIETVTKVTEGIEVSDYKVSKLSTNVDADSPARTRAVTNYKCIEPQLF